MAEYLASPLQKNTELNAVVGTNIEISPTRVGELLGWFKEALGKGETVQKSVDYANDEMAKIWKQTALEPVMPRLSCYGPDINLTLEQIRQKARKK